MIFKSDKDRDTAYRITFGTPMGRMVLLDILGMLGFWETEIIKGMSPLEQNTLNLYAKKILMRAAGDEFGKIIERVLQKPKPKKKHWWDMTVAEFTKGKR